MISEIVKFELKEDNHTVTLFDVGYKGILEPKTFLNQFGHLDIPKLLYQGNITQEFINQVREGLLEGMTYEGVVCKGRHIKPGLPLMFKIKSNNWYNKIHPHSASNIIAAREETSELLDRLNLCRERIKNIIANGEDPSILLEEFNGWFPEE